MTAKKSSTQIRREVSKSYAARVTKPVARRGSKQARSRRSAVVELAGYSPKELAAMPDGAVDNAFGCGNPLGMAGVGPGDVVLDLGSGAGLDLMLAAEKVGPTGRVIGIDMTDEMIAKANKNIRKKKLTNVEVRKGLIEKMPVESTSVDWVISNCVINLSPEKPRVFREIARVLKPGGQMLISDMVAEELPPTLRQFKAMHTACLAGAITEKDYLAGLRAAGLAGVAVRRRLVYDTAQITEGAKTLALESSAVAEMTARFPDFAQMLEGKIWSAKFYARKPR